MSDFESIIEKLRPFGPYQIRVFMLVSLFETPLAWAMLLPIFTSARPSWTCDGPNFTNISSNLTISNQKNINSCTPSQDVCSGVNFSNEFTSIITEWKLICNNDYIPGLITSIQMAGVMVGAIITGQLADYFGRRKILFLEYGLLICVWFASAFSNSWELYTVLRFVIGGLVGGTLVVNFVLPLEFITPKWRTFCGCIGFWAVGLATLALWAYVLRDWRYLTMGTSASSIFLLFCWWFVPESPRWLISRGRLKEAMVILNEMAVCNNRSAPEYDQLKSCMEIEKRKIQEQKKFSYCHLFSSWKLTKGTLILMYSWFVSSSVYYGLNFNTKNLSGNRYLNVFISGLVEIPALIFVVLINNKIGRRKTIAILMLIAGTFCVSILIVDVLGKLEEWPALTLTLAMIGKSGIAGGWAAVQVFSAETFPTVVRNLGIGACSTFARIGGIVAPQLVYLGNVWKPIPFTIFGIIAILCGVLMIFMVETVGQPLPDHINKKIKVITADNGDTNFEEVPLSNHDTTQL
ncbi:organic cation transporter protein isoform X1 [Patella vulgata]|uniref:organic cation transporter protein isoform X1 n=1 Tax=Patella vulgata TaxID=6465 RepID=UPI00217F9561|nr:organic cation transporter protein isoform X1 [Patella vulgata]XP_050402199.1 organic cation transporter protein isoform X1 [Patella vulgata]